MQELKFCQTQYKFCAYANCYGYCLLTACINYEQVKLESEIYHIPNYKFRQQETLKEGEDK